MREHVMNDLNIPQNDVNTVFSLIADVIAGWDIHTLVSQSFEKIRDSADIVHDYLHHALLISESGCDPEVTDILLEIAQRKIEMGKSPSFPQISQIILLRRLVPYIQKRPNPERILDMLDQLCVHSTKHLVTKKIEHMTHLKQPPQTRDKTGI